MLASWLLKRKLKVASSHSRLAHCGGSRLRAAKDRLERGLGGQGSRQRRHALVTGADAVEVQVQQAQARGQTAGERDQPGVANLRVAQVDP